ncbi:hypothetical protein [Clostridium sp. KNHs216]|uniref:hypothetical protein n=1 Tax=Clostridium sp. KNHs216 TaxID=1550235 RepID=UPI001FA99CC5|nr:hypothetical protein [Clostridium sp. KNHs216]
MYGQYYDCVLCPKRTQCTQSRNCQKTITQQVWAEDKAAGWIGAVVTIIVAILVKMSGHAWIGGSLFAGFIEALAAVATFLLKRNIADKISRKIYSFFLLVGVDVFINLLNLMGVNGFMLAWGVSCFFGNVIGMMNQ